MNPMAYRFENARKIATNMPDAGEIGNYTAELFQSDFPQFYKKEMPENKVVV